MRTTQRPTLAWTKAARRELARYEQQHGQGATAAIGDLALENAYHRENNVVTVYAVKSAARYWRWQQRIEQERDQSAWRWRS